MPTTFTNPGVYVQESPGGERAIVGVATSTAAFVGWAARGDVDRPNLVTSWRDFEELYGGLDPRSFLGYSVQHFFLNGGRRAWIVRLAHTDAGTASVTLDGIFRIEARNPGNWGRSFCVVTRRSAGDPERFELRVMHRRSDDAPAQTVEVFEDLTFSCEGGRCATELIEQESRFLRLRRLDGLDTPIDSPSDSKAWLAGTGDLDGSVLEPGTAEFAARLTGSETGAGLLDRVDLFNILCVPGETDVETVRVLQRLCWDRRAFYIVDSEPNISFEDLRDDSSGNLARISGAQAANSALYYPWVEASDASRNNTVRAFPPCGFVAGIYARTDEHSGVWKAPAGFEADISAASGLARALTDQESGDLNRRAVNCLRSFSSRGLVVWGARTLRGSDQLGSEWKYVPVRRLALYLEESLYRGTDWVVFEPNDEALWARLRLSVETFCAALFRRGAFQGSSRSDAYFVKCDRETTAQADIDRGVVNLVVGFAPLKPAEFVVIRLELAAGRVEG